MMRRHFWETPVFFDLGLIIRARFTILRKRGAQVERPALWRCQTGLLNSAPGCIGQETLSPSFADADSAKKQAMSNNKSRMDPSS